jgi:uncharacterized protein
MSWTTRQTPELAALADQTIDLTAIPYFAWANRKAGPMRVWLPRFEE